MQLAMLTLLLSFAYSAATSDLDPSTLTGEALVDYVNSLDTSWTATMDNFAPGVNPDIYKTGGSLDIDDPPGNDTDIIEYPFKVLDSVPTTFDAREAWPNCADVISTIRDQAQCGCCWAIAVAGAISDRICINMHKPVLVSTQDIMSCCRYCGYGCRGGWQYKAWQFYKQYGVVSGGLYDSKEGCSPYPFPPCNHIYNTSLESNREKMKFCGKPNVYSNTPKCTRTCEAGYTVPYASDKHFAYYYYKFTSRPMSYRVLSIMSEIYISGSVTASFTFYDDLFYYKGGVYHHTSGRKIYGHCVRIIGWGTEGGVDYWLIANSFNTFWGDGGYFKMRRGTNECGIENLVIAGLPRL